MEDVPSSLIARNESWVRQQAGALMRRVPSNVEKADLIQAGLIAVAQAALSFEHEGDRDTEAARDAFVRYARFRVKGAMLDELRQMDSLTRTQRRKINVVQIARERWTALNGVQPTLGELSGSIGMGVDEIAQLDQSALDAHAQSLDEPDARESVTHAPHPATPRDEVEARVDTAIVMRRLAKFFETLPERDRQVIDAYLGIGMSPSELAGSFKISAARMSQMYREVCRRIAAGLGQGAARATDDSAGRHAVSLNQLITERELELTGQQNMPSWGDLMEQTLVSLRNAPAKSALGQRR